MGLVDPGAHQAIGRGELHARVHALHLVRRGRLDDADAAGRDGHGDQVRQVVLTVGVLRQGSYGTAQPRHVGAVDPAIDLPKGLLARCQLLVFLHADDTAAGIAQHAPVALRIGDDGAEQAQQMAAVAMSMQERA